MNMKFVFFLKCIKIIYKILLKILSTLSILVIKINTVNHKRIFNKLKPYFNKTLNILNNEKLKQFTGTNINSKIIWIFWWQGMHNMPLVVKRCIQSVYRQSNGHKVVFLDKNNIKKYTNIPKYIYYKLHNNNISLAHFSDILRFNVLYRYGGLWVDSTMFCTAPITNEYFSNIYTSNGGNNRYNQFVSDKWTSFLIGGCRHSSIFKFMNVFYKLYWKKNNYIINYFLMDYVLLFIYKNNIGSFYTYTNDIAYKNNPKLYSLVKHLNDRFSLYKYKCMNYDTNFFKLTYKKQFDIKHDTFYRRIMNKMI